MTSVAGEILTLQERAGGKIEEPRANHAAPPPDLGDIAEIQRIM